jgi:hypothetical protein
LAQEGCCCPPAQCAAAASNQSRAFLPSGVVFVHKPGERGYGCHKNHEAGTKNRVLLSIIFVFVHVKQIGWRMLVKASR